VAKTFFLTFGDENLGESYDNLTTANAAAEELEKSLGQSVLVWSKEGHRTEIVTQGETLPEKEETFFLTTGDENLGEVFNTLGCAHEACLAFEEALNQKVLIWSKKGFLSQLVELGPSL
jgi:hypothetical protein